MKKKCYKIISIMFFIIILILSNKTRVNAASANISASSNNVEVGDDVNINISVDAIAWNIKVNGSGISDSITGYDMDSNKTTNKSYKLDTSKPGTYTVKLSGDATDANGTIYPEKTVTIKVSEKSNSSGTTTSTSKTTTTNDSSSNNSNNDNSSNKSNNDNSNKKTTQEPTFTTSNKTAYATGDINVRSSYSSSSSAVGSLKKGDSVTIIGEGSNGWSKVSYNGTTAYIKSDLLTATKLQEENTKKSEEKSTNKALKSLDIEAISLEPEFNKDTTIYSVTVGKDIEKLNINAVAESESANITITGNENLQIGENTVKVLVTAEDGTVRTYTIIVKKQEEDTLGLASLKINGVSLNESFKSSTYEYTVNLKGNEDLTKLDITAIANKEDATVEIIGNENLVIGENVITIMVKSKDGKENVTYQILVNKPEKSSVTITSDEEETNSSSKMFLYVAIGIFFVALLLIILIIVRSIKKSKEDDYDEDEEDDDAYGFKYNEDNNITEELYGIKNRNESHEEEIPVESTKTKLYDVEKEVDFSEDEERRPRRKGKHSK